MQVFFKGTGLHRTNIDWDQFCLAVEEKQGKLCNYVLRPEGDTIKIDQFQQECESFRKMGEILLAVRTRVNDAAVPHSGPAMDPNVEKYSDKMKKIRTTLLDEVKAE